MTYLISVFSVYTKLETLSGSVNKIKVIKRIIYGRNSFELLKAKVLFGELFHNKFN